jgi:Uncharacterized protein conserved in bacteria
VNWEKFITAFQQYKPDVETIIDSGLVYPSLGWQESLVVDYVSKRLQIKLESLVRDLSEIFIMCHSPIEEAFLFATVTKGPYVEVFSEERDKEISAMIGVSGARYPITFFCGEPVDESDVDLVGAQAPWKFKVYPQLGIGKRRVDFLFEAHQDGIKKSEIIIECDGYEFHDAKIETKIKDKKRERELMAEGYQMLRFSGSEIYSDATRCAEEVFDFLRGADGDKTIS